jgi:predicted signal transduction protein with EAL and GGDEF domain
VIRRAFNDLTHSSAFGEFRVTLSCGIASMPPAPDATTLVEWADRALYRAKSSGRNQVALLPESEQHVHGAARTSERWRLVRQNSSVPARSPRTR